MLDPTLDSMTIEAFYIERLGLTIACFLASYSYSCKHARHMHRLCVSTPMQSLREAEREGSNNFIELPLEELRKIYTTPIQQEFLQKQVVDSPLLSL